MEAGKNMDRISLGNEDATSLERHGMGTIHYITGRNRCNWAERDRCSHQWQYDTVVDTHMLGD